RRPPVRRDAVGSGPHRVRVASPSRVVAGFFIVASGWFLDWWRPALAGPGGFEMRFKGFCCAVAIATVMASGSPLPMTALGKPGVTPVPCPQQAWQPGDPAFEALPGA